IARSHVPSLVSPLTRCHIELMIEATVGEDAARVDNKLEDAETLEELPGTEGEERWDEDEVRHGDQHGHDRDAPPPAEPGERATHTLVAAEVADRDGTGAGLAVVTP